MPERADVVGEIPRSDHQVVVFEEFDDAAMLQPVDYHARRERILLDRGFVELCSKTFQTEL
jgi:hypothetical protein